MLATCPACRARRRLDPDHPDDRLTCKRCGAALPRADRDAPDDRTERPSLVLFIAVLFGMGAVLHGSGAVLLWVGAPFPMGRVFAALASVLCGCSAAAAAGLWRLRAWGWWAGCLAAAVSFLLNLKLLSRPLSRLNWDHPEAGRALLWLGARYGLPILVALVLGALLALPRVRLAVGVKDRPLPTRRRAPHLGARRVGSG